MRVVDIKIIKKHVAGPQGVRGRNSDNFETATGSGLGAANQPRRGRLAMHLPLDRRDVAKAQYE